MDKKELNKQMQFLLYNTNDENISVNALVKDESIWLTQKSMAELFDVAENNITYHLQNIFNDNELIENRTTQKIRVVRKEGARSVSREVTFYNLDAIISVGYRVNSKRATNFRIWATSILKEYTEFNKTQVIESDFDKKIKKLINNN